MKKILLTAVGIICSLAMMADDVTFGLTQAIDSENKTIGAVSYTGTTNVTNSGVQNGTKVDSYKATGAKRSVYIDNVQYTSDSQWRKNENTSAYTANQWTGYSLTIATGYKLNITGVHAMLAVADDTYTWKVSILDASDNVLYESQNKTTKKASTTDFTLNYASLSEQVKANLTGITGTIKVRVYMYQGGQTKYFAIPYLTVTGNVEESNTPSYTVTATANPVAGGTVSGDGSWEEGKNVTLTATPNTGYKFVKWTIDETNDYTENPYTISSINADHSVVATFEALPKITYALGEGAGVVPAADYAEAGSNVTLPSAQTQLIYKEGYTMTGWSDGENTYAIGAQAPVTGDMTFTAVFEENQAALGDEAVTVDWNFKTSTGAPAGAFEGNTGYYAKKATIGGKSVDVIMKINTETGASGLKDDKGNDCRGKWNTVADANRAQINKGTILTIPAIKGMVITMTITNGTADGEMFTFADVYGGEGNAAAKTVSFTYYGDEETIDIIDLGRNTYPAGLSVDYPAIEKGEESDLALSSNTANVDKNRTATVTFTSSSTGAVTATSDKTDIATVAVNGNNIEITGVAGGTAIITVAQEADATYKSGIKTINVTVTDPLAPTTVFDLATSVGSFEVGSSYVTVSGEGTASCSVKLSSSLTTVDDKKDNYLKITPGMGRFKAGDVISFTGYYNNSVEKESAITIYKDEVTDENLLLEKSEQFANIHKNFGQTATSQSFTLTSDAEALFIGRNGSTTTYIYGELTVSRPATVATANINASGYGTFSCGYDVQITGAKAYKAAIDGDQLVCTEITNGLVPAGEGVLLFKEGTTEATTATALFAASAPAVENNVIKATTLADGSLKDIAEVTSQKILVLSGDSFVPYNGAAFVADKAYIPYDAPAGAKSFRIVFAKGGQTTGIKTVSAQKVANAKFIENGHIVIVKDGAKYNVAGQVIK